MSIIGDYEKIAKLLPFESKQLEKEIFFEPNAFKYFNSVILNRTDVIGIYTIRRCIAKMKGLEQKSIQLANLVASLNKINDEKVSLISLSIKEKENFLFMICANIQLDKVFCVVELGFNQGEL